MFDLNGDGEVDVDEFEKVRDVVLNSTSVGHRHRDRSTTGNIAGSVGDALVEYFFGLNKDGKLTVEKFGEFHAQLLEEILRLEVLLTVLVMVVIGKIDSGPICNFIFG